MRAASPFCALEIDFSLKASPQIKARIRVDGSDVLAEGAKCSPDALASVRGSADALASVGGPASTAALSTTHVEAGTIVSPVICGSWTTVLFEMVAAFNIGTVVADIERESVETKSFCDVADERNTEGASLVDEALENGRMIVPDTSPGSAASW